MAKRTKDLHVVREDAGWAVRGAGEGRSAVYRTQGDAIERAREIAKAQGSEVMIHGRDGRLRARLTYGKDPLPPKSEPSDLIRRVAHEKERVVIELRGEEPVALVPLEDLAVLQRLEDRADLAEAREVLAEIEREGTVSWEQVKAELGL